MSENTKQPTQAPQATQQGDLFNQPQPVSQPTTQPNVAQPEPTALAPKPTYGIANLREQLNVPATIQSFRNLLGEKGAARFTSALMNIVGQSAELQKAETKSIILAAGQSAALNLPLNPSLGLACVLAYWDKKKGPIDPNTGRPIGQYVAQFQMMRNGLMELAQRSGKVIRIANEVVYEGELKSHNRFTDEYDFTGTRTSNKVIGYMAYAKLNTGFEKTIYMTVEEAKAHGMRFSKTYKKGFGVWVDDFNEMALKTVLKKLINKWLPKTEEMAMALESDQATFAQGEIGNATPEYLDNDHAFAKFAESEPVEAIEVDNVEAEEVK